MPESITLTSRVFRILIPLFTSSLQFLVQLVRATLTQLLGYACPDVRLRVSDLAVTILVRFCGGRFDSFLGFEYVVMVTLASHVFEGLFWRRSPWASLPRVLWSFIHPLLQTSSAVCS